MQVFFINLDHRQDRRQFMEQQLHSLGLKAQRFEAVSPATVTIRPRETRHAEMAAREAMTETELACLESHYTLWKRSAADEEPVLILEDDVVLSKRLAAFLATLRLSAEWDILRLETNFLTVRLDAVEITINGRKAHRVMQPQSGAGAYILSPSASRALIASPHFGGVPADTLLFSPPHAYDFKVFQLVPALATHLEQLYAAEGSTVTQSDIGLTRSWIVQRAAAKNVARYAPHFARGAAQARAVARLIRSFPPTAVLRSRRMQVPFER